MPKTVTKAARDGAGRKPLSRALRFYQRIAVAFVVVTFFLLLAVLYLSISRATLHVIAKQTVVSATSTIAVSGEAPTDATIQGVVKEQSVDTSRTFDLPQDGASAVEEKAHGTVTIINDSSKDQPLVAKTRFLSKEGVLFRLDKDVTAPAGQHIDATIHADVAGPLGDVPPTQFTIPGLNATLQTKIYGVSVNAMTGGLAYKRVVTEADENDAALILQKEAEDTSHTALATDVDRTTYDGVAYKTEVVSRSSDVPVGTEASSFTVSLSVRVTAVFYKKSDVDVFARSMLATKLADGFALVAANAEGPQVTVLDADIKRGTASLSVYIDGTSMISTDSQALDVSRFLGRSPGEVVTLLKGSEGVEDASVTFTPFWLARVPTLKDHVVVDITPAK